MTVEKGRIMTVSNTKTFAGLSVEDETIETKPGACFGFYGTGGAGKTTIMAEAVLSKYGTPALLVDNEGGSSSVTHLKKYGLDIVKPKDWNEITKLRKQLQGDHSYKAVMWDNLCEIATLCMKSVTPLEIPQIQHYGQRNQRILEFVREQRDLARLSGVHVFFCLWEEIDKEELTGMVRKQIALSPQLRGSIPGILTMIGRITVPSKNNPTGMRLLDFAASETQDSKYRVAPTDAAAKIPQQLWIRKDGTNDVNFVVDFLNTIIEGIEFPAKKYAPPTKPTN